MALGEVGKHHVQVYITDGAEVTAVMAAMHATHPDDSASIAQIWLVAVHTPPIHSGLHCQLPQPAGAAAQACILHAVPYTSLPCSAVGSSTLSFPRFLALS